MKRKKRGFTLIELVIVVAIIGILALLVIPQFSRAVEQARVAKFKNNCKVVNSAMMKYYAEKGNGFPPNTTALSENFDGSWESVAKSDKDATYDYNVNINPVFTATLTNVGSVTYTYTVARDGTVTATPEAEW